MIVLVAVPVVHKTKEKMMMISSKDTFFLRKITFILYYKHAVKQGRLSIFK